MPFKMSMAENGSSGLYVVWVACFMACATAGDATDTPGVGDARKADDIGRGASHIPSLSFPTPRDQSDICSAVNDRPLESESRDAATSLDVTAGVDRAGGEYGALDATGLRDSAAIICPVAAPIGVARVSGENNPVLHPDRFAVVAGTAVAPAISVLDRKSVV